MKFNQKIHLKDFPEDKIVVFLEDEFREELIDNAIKSFSRKRLAEHLNIRKLDTITRWKKAKIKRSKNWITPQGIPLNKLKTLLKLLNVDLNNIEKYVTAYKSRGKSLLIKNPNLPVKESPKLFRIIAHMMGDGSAEESNVNYFKNFDKLLLNEFMNDVRNVFGNVELSLNKDNIVFPISIRHILSKVYNINFGTFNADIPKRLFELPPKYAGAFIQGFFDDEGSVDSSCIRFYSYNKNLLEGIRNLLITKFPEIGSTASIKSKNKQTGVEYCFSVNAKGLENFYKMIGCTHSSKKERLKFYMDRKNKNWNHRDKGNTKSMIIDSLSNNTKTAYELAKELMVSRGTIRDHLFGYNDKRKRNAKGLIELGLIEIKGIGKYNARLFGLR